MKKKYSKEIRKVVFPGIQGGPLMHVIAAKAVAFKQALGDDFKVYQQAVVHNARKMADDLLEAGIQLITGGTDNHMLLVDLHNLGLTGKEAEAALGRAGITANKNSIPFDERGPAVTSGIRLGTPVVTSRGMVEADMVRIAEAIDMVLSAPEDEAVIAKARAIAQALSKQYPLPYAQ